ncbi:MAG: efflux RND transporter periplasmic adaptor subunit [Planctomycetota bacterium]
MSRTQLGERASTKPGRRWLRLAICAGLIALGVVGVVLVARMPPASMPLPPTELTPVNVITWRVAPLPELPDMFDLTAVVEPEQIVKVSAEVAGRIERRAERVGALTWRGRDYPQGAILAEGEPIARGEPILYLNKDLLQARHDRAAAQFDYDEREFRRIQDLFERGSTSKTELDDARTRRDVSKAALDEVVRELERTTVTAPVSGILNRLPMEVGEYAGPGDVVAEIVVMDRVKVVVDIPERDVHFLKVGDPVTIVAVAPEERSLTGRITYMNAVADPGTRTTRIEVLVDNYGHLLRSGQIVRARLTRRVLRDVIMIPLGSVIPLERGRAVYVVRDGQAERRDVELGVIKGRDVQVLSGLAAGDQLIVEGHRYVGPGQPVKVVEEQ